MKSVLAIIFMFSILNATSNSVIDPVKLYKKCAGCHGIDGKNRAFAISDIIAGQDVDDLIDSIDFYKNSKMGSRNVTMVMGKQVKHLSDKQIKILAEYISKLGGKK